MKAIERVSIVEQVIESLKAYMEENELKPGDRMPTEKEICDSLGVGRSTVREAYRMMKAMELVTTVQGKGVFVSERKHKVFQEYDWFSRNGESVVDYMEVRMAIEPLAVRLAVERGSEGDRKRLFRLHQMFLSALEEKNAVKLAAYDEAFHRHIVDMTGNQLLIRIEDSIVECLKEYRIRAFGIEENQIHALEPHEGILEAFRRQDSQLGMQVMIEHVKISLDDVAYAQAKAEDQQ